MSSHGDKLGRRRFGRLTPVNPEALAALPPVEFKDFSGGLYLAKTRHEVPANCTPAALDTEASSRDRIKRTHGVITEEAFATHEPSQMLVHASLDYSAELLLFAAPYLGIKKEAATVWYDVGLDGKRPYGYANHGGYLIFSNGVDDKVWLREFGATTISDVPEAPASRVFASFAGRVFAGNTVIGGNVEKMGLNWSAASSAPEDWTGPGAGFELLIDDMSAGDRILAMQTIGLDFLAVLCRNSIWVGRRTGLTNRPADFQPRVPRIGTVSEATVSVTRQGIIFLHDSGVYLFDGNTATHISEQIDRGLLPLDYTKLDEYSSAYNPRTQKYYLFTPTATWVYDLKKGRWAAMSLKAVGAVIWAEQFKSVTWDELVGTWDEQTLDWDEFSPAQGDEFKMWFLGVDSETNHALGIEDETVATYFGIPQTPYWQMPVVQGQPMNSLFTYRRALLEHIGSGLVGFRNPNSLGDFVGVAVYDLAGGAADRVVNLTYLHTGLGVGLQLDFGCGSLEVSKISLELQQRSARIDPAAPAREVGHPDYDYLTSIAGA